MPYEVLVKEAQALPYEELKPVEDSISAGNVNTRKPA